MKVKRNSWHYKISNWGRRYSEISDGNDNLCWYFWRMILKCMLVFVITAYAGTMTYFIVSDIDVLFTVLFVCSLFAFPTLAIWLLRKMLGKSPQIPGGEIVTGYLEAKKAKICPLIEYTD